LAAASLADGRYGDASSELQPLPKELADTSAGSSYRQASDELLRQIETRIAERLEPLRAALATGPLARRTVFVRLVAAGDALLMARAEPILARFSTCVPPALDGAALAAEVERLRAEQPGVDALLQDAARLRGSLEGRRVRALCDGEVTDGVAYRMGGDGRLVIRAGGVADGRYPAVPLADVEPLGLSDGEMESWAWWRAQQGDGLGSVAWLCGVHGSRPSGQRLRALLARAGGDADK